MKMLALELSSALGSIASCDDRATRDFRTFPADRKNSALFYETLQTIYRQSDPPDVIIVGIGPGSYAGVRISIATALGLRAASSARLRGLPSICGIERDEYFFVGDARRNSFVFAHVIDGRCEEGPLLASEEELRMKLSASAALPVIATQSLPQFSDVTVEHPSALRLIELARRRPGDFDETLEPIYLRAPYITTPGK